jgi:hypothetical protein
MSQAIQKASLYNVSTTQIIFLVKLINN